MAALLNGIVLQLHDEPTCVTAKQWQQEPVKTLLHYGEYCQPSSVKLATAQAYLAHTLNLTETDINPFCRLLRTAGHVPGAKWVVEEVVRAHYN